MEPKPMRIELKDGAKSPDTAASLPAEERFIRKLDHPYFELRTPDAQANSYLEGNALKMITSEQEKIGAFLAEARLVIDLGASPRKRSVHYQISPEKFKN